MRRENIEKKENYLCKQKKQASFIPVTLSAHFRACVRIKEFHRLTNFHFKVAISFPLRARHREFSLQPRANFLCVRVCIRILCLLALFYLTLWCLRFNVFIATDFILF